MKYKLNTHYIVTKGNIEKDILEGNTLVIRFDKNTDPYSRLKEYTIFLSPRKTQKDFFGMPPMNYVLYFETEEEVSEVMSTIEIKYNIELVKKLINDKQKEIDEIKQNHELDTVSNEQKYDDSKSADDYYDSPFNGVFQG